MIRGNVNANREAILHLRLHGPTGSTAEVDAIIDTGFTGSLVLPDTVVASLSLARLAGGSAVLADGSVRRFDNYGVEVEWDGVNRGIIVSAMGTEALVGTGLLAGHELRVHIEPSGIVEIRPLR